MKESDKQFSWELMEINKRRIKIQLIFSIPEKISQPEPDKLKIKFEEVYKYMIPIDGNFEGVPDGF